MAKFIGNISHKLDTISLLKNLGPGRSETIFFKDQYGAILEEYKNNEFVKRAVLAGYPDPYVTGKLYYAGFDFSEYYIKQLDQLFGTICVRCFINQTDPGMIVPPHYDVPTEDREEKLKEIGTIEAYHVHIGEPKTGQILMLEGQALYMQENGNCYKWDDYLNWHSACNIGYETKYVLLYKGIRTFKPFNYSYEFTDDDDNVKIILEDGTKI